MGPFNMPNMLVFIESASIQNMCNKSRLIPSINGHNLRQDLFQFPSIDKYNLRKHIANLVISGQNANAFPLWSARSSCSYIKWTSGMLEFSG